jgi:hypothetical protein
MRKVGHLLIRMALLPSVNFAKDKMNSKLNDLNRAILSLLPQSTDSNLSKALKDATLTPIAPKSHLEVGQDSMFDLIKPGNPLSLSCHNSPKGSETREDRQPQAPLLTSETISSRWGRVVHPQPVSPFIDRLNKQDEVARINLQNSEPREPLMPRISLKLGDGSSPRDDFSKATGSPAVLRINVDCIRTPGRVTQSSRDRMSSFDSPLKTNKFVQLVETLITNRSSEAFEAIRYYMPTPSLLSRPRIVDVPRLMFERMANPFLHSNSSTESPPFDRKRISRKPERVVDSLIDKMKQGKQSKPSDLESAKESIDPNSGVLRESKWKSKDELALMSCGINPGKASIFSHRELRDNSSPKAGANYRTEGAQKLNWNAGRFSMINPLLNNQTPPKNHSSMIKSTAEYYKQLAEQMKSTIGGNSQDLARSRLFAHQTLQLTRPINKPSFKGSQEDLHKERVSKDIFRGKASSIETQANHLSGRPLTSSNHEKRREKVKGIQTARNNRVSTSPGNSASNFNKAKRNSQKIDVEEFTESHPRFSKLLRSINKRKQKQS